MAGHRFSTGSFEEVIAQHPDVAECAVIGVADKLKVTSMPFSAYPFSASSLLAFPSPTYHLLSFPFLSFPLQYVPYLGRGACRLCDSEKRF